MKNNMDNENTVPELDLNAELPEMEAPVQDEVMTSAKREWKMGLLVFGVFVMMLGGTVWAYTLNNQKVSEVSKSAEQQISEVGKSGDQQVSEPVVAVKPVFAIFNGSGISGAAGKLKIKIEAAGYEVVEVGNADAVQTGTTVEISSALENQKDEIVNILGLEKGTEPAGMILAGTLKYNIKVIIGK